MVFHVAEVGVGERGDGYGPGGGILGCEWRGGVGDVRGGTGVGGFGGLDEGVGIVLAEGVDEAGDGGDLGAEEGELGGEDVAEGLSKWKICLGDTYRAFEWAMVGSTRTSSSSSAMLSS